MKARTLSVLIIGSALLFAVVTALSLTGHAALVLSIWGQTITAVYACTLLVYFIVTMSKYFDPSIEASSPRFVRRRIDEYQGRWRWMILLQVFSMLPFFAFLPQVFWVFGAHLFMRTILCGIIAFLMIILVYMLSAGPGFSQPGASDLIDDEFARALRARMMRFAYIFAMLLLGAVLVVTLWQPSLTLAVLSWALYAGFAVPALYYVIADWRASSAGEDRDG